MIVYFLFSAHTGGGTKSILEVIKETKGAAVFLSDGPIVAEFKKYTEVFILNATGFSHTQMLWRKNIFLIPFDISSAFVSFLKTMKFLKNKNYKIAHINSSALLPQLIACKLMGLKTLTHIREPIAEGYLGVRKKIVIALIKKFSDRIIAISKMDAKTFSCEVVYNPVRGYDGKITPKYVVMMGGISKPKGTAILLKVAKLLPQIKFVVAGEVPPDFFDGKGLKAFIKKHLWFMFYSGICKKIKPQNVVFAGAIKEIDGLLKEAGVVAITNTVSHFSRPIIEAYYSGIPVVAFDMPHIKEVFIEGSGALVKPFDINEFASKIKTLFEKGISIEAKNKMMAFARENFSPEKHIEKIKKIYAELA